MGERPSLPASRSRTNLACLLAALAFHLGIPAPPARCDVKIKQEGKACVVTTPKFTATISEDGLLGSLKAADLELLAGAKADAFGGQPTVGQTNPAEVEARFALNGEETARLTYAFTDEQIVWTVRHSVRGKFGSLSVSFSEAAQTVTHLKNQDTRSLPLVAGASSWLETRWLFSNGTKVAVVSTGPRNHLNPDEDGMVSKYAWRRNLLSVNTDYALRFIIDPGQPGKVLLAAPPLGIAPDRAAGVFFDDHPLGFKVILRKDFAQRIAAFKDDLKLRWQVIDYTGAEVARGESPIALSADANTVVEVKPDLKRVGWFRLKAALIDTKGRLLESEDSRDFCRLTHVPGMGEKAGGDEFDRDALVGLYLMRVSPGFPKDKDKTNWKDLDKKFQTWAKRSQETGVRYFVLMGGDFPAWLETPKDMHDYMLEFVGRYKDYNKLWEVVNEPDGRFQAKYFIEMGLQPAYEAAKKADPNAKIMAPILCGFRLDWLREFYRLGGGKYMDLFSIHPYGGNFDDSPVLDNLVELRKLLAANGQADIPVYFTESGYFFDRTSLDSLRSAARMLVVQYPLMAAYGGVKPEDFFYYFTSQMGYLHMYLMFGDGTMLPAAVARRMQAARLTGTDFVRRLDFGSADFLRGFEYAGKARRTIMLWACGCEFPAELQVTGGGPGEAGKPKGFDMMGNEIPLDADSGGSIKLKLGPDPVYVELPPEAKVKCVPCNWGANQALLSAGAQPAASSEQPEMPAANAFDGLTYGASSWRPAIAGDLPQWIGVTLPGLMNVNRVVVWGRALRSFEVQCADAQGKWVKTAEVSGADRGVHAIQFQPFQTDRVRLLVSETNETWADVAELEVFAADGTGGGGLVNWAAASNGATATASSTLVKEVHYSEQPFGAKEPKKMTMQIDAAARNAIDGARPTRSSTWQDFLKTTWISGEPGKFPQWLEVKFADPPAGSKAEPKSISSVVVYNIAWARWSPDQDGNKDFEIQAEIDGKWKTLKHVKDNKDVCTLIRLAEPVKTQKVRVLVSATNDPGGYCGIAEVQAFGAK